MSESELPVPFGVGKKELQSNAFKVQAVQFVEREFGKHRVEYGKKGDKLIFHFFKDGPYPLSFRSKLFGGFSNHMRIRDSANLDIEWVQELDSWCVIVPNVSAMPLPPTDEMIVEMLEEICS